jgi:hypothetical protein
MNLVYLESELEQFDLKKRMKRGTSSTLIDATMNEYPKNDSIHKYPQSDSNLHDNNNKGSVQEDDMSMLKTKIMDTKLKDHKIDSKTRYKKKTILDSTINGLYRDLNKDIAMETTKANI